MPKTILIVEDHDDSRNLLKFLLENNGYSVMQATDGLEAVQRVKQHLPDLILMDLALPEIDGVCATRLIREMDGTSEVLIFVVTAHWEFYYREAQDKGINGVLRKPLDHPKLLKLVKQCLTPSEYFVS